VRLRRHFGDIQNGFLNISDPKTLFVNDFKKHLQIGGINIGQILWPKPENLTKFIDMLL
jgi:hypothetical protein